MNTVLQNSEVQEPYVKDWKLSAEEHKSKWRHHSAVVKVDLKH